MPLRPNQKQPYTIDSQKKQLTDFNVTCTFQGHYREPELTLKVPIEKLKSEKAIEFEMVYHVDTGKFKSVKIINS